MHHVERGSRTAVVVPHGTGVDHRPPMVSLDSVLGGRSGYRRLSPDDEWLDRVEEHRAAR